MIPNLWILQWTKSLCLSLDNYPNIEEDKKKMENIPYTSVVDSLMYVIMCAQFYVYHIIGMVSTFQSNPKIVN